MRRDRIVVVCLSIAGALLYVGIRVCYDKLGMEMGGSNVKPQQAEKIDASLHSGGMEMTKPIFKNGVYDNPWKTWHSPRFLNVMKFVFLEKDVSKVPAKASELDETLPILKPDNTEFLKPLEMGIRTMWIGHATVLVQMDGVTILTDPVFSQRCGPTSFMGPKRYRDPPCKIKDLPKIDAVVISHNHYDHLDSQSVSDLNARFGAELTWFVPEGLESWMRDMGCQSVVELSWWQETSLPGRPDFKFVSTPCQHWCRRGAFDYNKVLWCSWTVLGPRHRFFFGGDTGYCEGFKQIGAKYGPFTLAAIPIGAYEPNWFMKYQHVNPEQAVDIHTDIRAQTSLGIHWGTFKLTYEHYLEPRERLLQVLESRSMRPSEFVTTRHGEICVFGADNFKDVD